MNHIPYAKMGYSVSKWNPSAKDLRLFKREWVVTEKVHGANFCVIVDKGSVQFAKRKELVEGNFFNYRSIADELRAKCLQLCQELKNDSIRVYGELFGGIYPHPDVKADVSAVPVQEGVYYSPGLHFMVFDVADMAGRFFDFDMWTVACDKIGVLRTQELFRGKLEDAMNYEVGFETTIPPLLGLPNIEDNIAEGIVVKPAESFTITTEKGVVRPVFKVKIPDFSEGKSQAPADDSIDEIFNKAIAPLINDARIECAISKVGNSDTDAIVEETILDVLEDAEQSLDSLAKWKRDAIVAKTEAMVRSLLKE